MAKSVLYNIYNDLVGAVKTIIDQKYIFLKNRPDINSGSSPMSKFAVIDLPVSVNDFVIGDKKTFLYTTGVFYLFTTCRSNGTLEVNATGEFIDDVISLFPIKGQYCCATRPVVRMSGNDGEGYQVVTISFDLQCKWLAFSNN